MNAMQAARASSDFSRSRKCSPSSADALAQFVAIAQHQVAGDFQRLRRLGGDCLGSGKHRRLKLVLRPRPDRSGRHPGPARPKTLRPAPRAQMPAAGPGRPGASRLEPASGTSPRSTKGVRKTVRGVAKVRSQCRLIVVPMPTAMPSTPETIGFSSSASAIRKSQTSRAALAARRDDHEIGEVVAGGKCAGHAENDVAAHRPGLHRRRGAPSPSRHTWRGSAHSSCPGGSCG